MDNSEAEPSLSIVYTVFIDREGKERLRFFLPQKKGDVPRFLVEGEETTDVERIGHALKQWVTAAYPVEESPPGREEAPNGHGFVVANTSRVGHGSNTVVYRP